MKNKLKWKKFDMKLLREAEEFAASGGIAIHLSGPASRFFTEDTPKHVQNVFGDREFAHMFGPDRESLTRAAVSIGCKPQWIQHPNNPKRMHFDITGVILARALKNCLEKTK